MSLEAESVVVVVVVVVAVGLSRLAARLVGLVGLLTRKSGSRAPS